MKASTKYSTVQLTEALRAITSLIGKCIKVQKKLRKGTSQYTLMKNRLKAFRISSVLIKKEAGKS